MPIGSNVGIVVPGLANIVPGSGKYIGPALPNATYDSGANSANFVTYVPFAVKSPITVDAIVWRHDGTGDSGDKVRVGLYDSLNGLPNSLLQAAAEQTLTATATTYASAITATQLVPNTLYFGASALDNSITMIRLITTQGLGLYADYPAITFATTGDVIGTYRESRAYAALPATAAPTAAANSGVQYAALLMLKVA